MFFLFFIGASLLMIHAVGVEIRGWILPWMIAMFSVILLQTYFALHWLFDYYIYVSVTKIREIMAKMRFETCFVARPDFCDALSLLVDGV